HGPQALEERFEPDRRPALGVLQHAPSIDVTADTSCAPALCHARSLGKETVAGGDRRASLEFRLTTGDTARDGRAGAFQPQPRRVRLDVPPWERHERPGC